MTWYLSFDFFFKRPTYPPHLLQSVVFFHTTNFIYNKSKNILKIENRDIVTEIETKLTIYKNIDKNKSWRKKIPNPKGCLIVFS